MKKSKCCNAQATLSRYQYICHKCKEICEIKLPLKEKLINLIKNL